MTATIHARDVTSVPCAIANLKYFRSTLGTPEGDDFRAKRGKKYSNII